ncbi:aromatic prenyltransferase [Echria macrotheca]|uniref:Aromatic prenyltransferase n=1 Tax=Echria macrotheca TaxID=438768 RepID=A0AAJ0B616_9PEZI|nr:aromatic prenyltransferase [Echria macrotheca]
MRLPDSPRPALTMDLIPPRPPSPALLSNTPNANTKADAKWWSDITLRHLHSLLSSATYPLKQQHRLLNFHRRFVAPHLGPSIPTSSLPSGFRSWMTDDSTPVEYSWKWGSKPSVRYSVELISPSSGTCKDPWNQGETLSFLCGLERDQSIIPGVDLTLFHRFYELFFGGDSGEDWEGLEQAARSTLFLGFELPECVGGGEDITLKAYFLPRERPGQSVGTQIFEAVRSVLGSLPDRNDPRHDTCKSLEALTSFLTSEKNNSDLSPFMLAVDCIGPSQSRLKIYARSPQTSFASVLSIMALAGRRVVSPVAEEQLRNLWLAVLGISEPDFDPDEELILHPSLEGDGNVPRGVLYYFDVAGDIPDVKVYIPVGRYSRLDDRAVARGLIGFMCKDGKGYAEAYERALRGISGGEADGGWGTHTYVSASYRGDGVVVTSYLSPQLYRQSAY